MLNNSGVKDSHPFILQGCVINVFLVSRGFLGLLQSDQCPANTSVRCQKGNGRATDLSESCVILWWKCVVITIFS